MLILTRRVGESLRIGEDGNIIVTVLGVKGNQTRLGIGAPREVAVHRSEIYQKIQEERKHQIEQEGCFPASIDQTTTAIDQALKESNLTERMTKEQEKS